MGYRHAKVHPTIAVHVVIDVFGSCVARVFVFCFCFFGSFLAVLKSVRFGFLFFSVFRRENIRTEKDILIFRRHQTPIDQNTPRVSEE